MSVYDFDQNITSKTPHKSYLEQSLLHTICSLIHICCYLLHTKYSYMKDNKSINFLAEISF